MEPDDIGKLKARFIKVFASVPIPLRGEIIAVVNDKPVSWDAAYTEIKSDSKEGITILKQLEKMGVLQ